MVRRFFICFAYACCVACGGATKAIPTTPSPTPATSTWTLSGRVVQTLNAQPIAGAKISPYNVSTSNDGSFTATGSGVRTTDRVTVEAAGFVSRQTTIPSSTTAPVLDLFPSSLLDFYRQMVRNAYDDPGSALPVRRWSSPPAFYISQDGQLSNEDIRRITVGIQAAVSQLTPFSSPTIISGPSRADQQGTVTIAFVNSLNVGYCGFTTATLTSAHVNFNLAPFGTIAGGCAGFCRGGQIIPGTVAHEVGHALGFYHDADGVMQAGSARSYECSDNIQFTTAERQAAAIAYQRPSGNLDPDIDPN